MGVVRRPFPFTVTASQGTSIILSLRNSGQAVAGPSELGGRSGCFGLRDLEAKEALRSDHGLAGTLAGSRLDKEALPVST